MAAQNCYWRGINTSWNTASNWSTTDGGSGDGRVPTSEDAVYFTSNGNGSGCTLDVNAVCNTFTATASSWTGNFSMGGYTLTQAGAFNIASAGTWTLNSTITQTGDANFTIASTIGAFTGGGSLVLQGTGTLTINKNIAASTLLNITCGASGKTTTYTSNIDAAIMNGLLTVGAGTLALNYYFYMRADSANLFAQTGTITSASGKGFIIQYGTATAWNLPALTLGGNSYLYIANISNGTSWTITQTGNIVVGGSFSLLSALANSPIIFHTGANPYYNITTGTYFSFTGNANCNLTANLNSSTITCGTYFTATTSNNTINMGSSQISCGGSFTLAASDTIDAGTSLLTFTAAGTLTSAGKTLYDINAATGILTISGALACHTLSAVGVTGSISVTGYTITVASTVNFTATGAYTIGADASIIQTGDANFTIASTINTFAGGGSLDIRGTGILTISRNISSSPLLNVTCAYSGKTTTYTGLSNNSLSGTLTINGGTFINTANYAMRCDNSTPLVLVAGYTLTNNGNIYIGNGSATSVTLPAIVCGGSGTFRLNKYNTGAVAWNLGGTFNLGTNALHIYTNSATNSATFNSNDYAITCATIQTGSDQASTTTTINYGASAITVGGHYNTYNSGTQNVNYGSSQWLCSGNFAMGSNWTVNAGTSLITFTNNATLTSAGKTLYDIKIDTPAKILTNSGALSCNNLSITQGGFIQGTATITCSGNFYYPGASNGTLDSTFTMTGLNKVFSITSAGAVTTTLCVLILQNNTTITSGNRTISRMILTAGKTYTFATTNVLTITNFTAGDWSGTAGNLITWQSSSSGTASTIIAPANVLVNYCAVKDINNTGTLINANRVSNYDNTNNAGWKFPSRIFNSKYGHRQFNSVFN